MLYNNKLEQNIIKYGNYNYSKGYTNGFFTGLFVSTAISIVLFNIVKH
jgi:hypothetical protein